MGGEDDRDPAVGEFADEAVDDLAGLRVETGAGLIEEDETWSADEGRGQCNPLLLSAGESAHRASGEVVESQGLGELVHRQGILVEGGQVAQHLQRLRAHRQSAVLEHDPGQLRCRGVFGDGVVSEDRHRPGIGAAGAHSQGDGRGFARTVGSEDAEDGSGLGREVDSVDDTVGAVGVLETANGQGRR